MKISNDKHLRLIHLFYQNKLEKSKGRFAELSRIAALDGIEINRNNARILVRKWQQTGSVSTLPSVSRNLANTKVSMQQLNYLNSITTKNRFITARILKNKLKIAVSIRTVQKYFNLMGWRKIPSRFCQFVHRVNRIKRVIYANICLSINYKFDCTVFIDESKVQASKHAHKKWHKNFAKETRNGNFN